MKLGMLVIGSELLQGKISDLNTPWLAQFLRPWNVTLASVRFVADQSEDLQQALKELFNQCDTVICSGGLGPTADDITKNELARFFSRAMITSPTFQQIAQANYLRMGRTLASDHGYNFAPEGFITLNNQAGFAPGLFVETNGKRLLALPGVPKEFREMINEHFAKLIGPHLNRDHLKLLNFRTKGIPEEKIFFELCPGLWNELSKYGSVSSLPHTLGVDVAVTLVDADAQSLTTKVKKIQEIIYQSPLASAIWHEGFLSLEEVIIQKAAKKNITISFAESCTGGLCSHRLTNVSGSSAVFWGSVVSYDNSIKENLLQVNTDSIKTHGAVSEAVAIEMAQGARKKLATTIGISLTGIAGPGGGSDEKPVGTVWIGVSTEEKTSAKKFQFKGDRENLKLRFSQMALFELLDLL